MVLSEQHVAGLSELHRLLPLAESPHPFLSLYLDTQGETIPRNVHARIEALLTQCEAEVADTEWERAIREERGRVRPVVEELKPIGSGLVLFSSAEADVLVSLWLPSAVQDRVRLGRGAYVLPLFDVVDENEPVAVAFVEKDQARLLLIAGGRVLDAEHFSANVFGREKAGGWSAPRYERRREEQAAHHLRSTAEALDAFQRRHGFRRFFLSGPPEPLTVFRRQLPDRLASLVRGTVALDAHASDADVAVQVWGDAGRVEREDEVRFVEEIITRGEKGAGAVFGVAATLHALHYHQLATIALDPGGELPGRRCGGCARLLPEERAQCPWCGGAGIRTDLREELPRVVREEDVAMELVHDRAALLLSNYGGIGGILKPTVH